MKSVGSIPNKIYNLDQLMPQLNRWRLLNKTIVFTNGVFDIMHEGHVASLGEAALYGHILIVGINSDASVKRLKGDSRPIYNEGSRSLLMASMVMVDAVIIFEEDTPLDLIKAIMPDVLVKGGDYTLDQIVGSKEVLAYGGEVKRVPILDGFSTTGVIEKMKEAAR